MLAYQRCCSAIGACMCRHPSWRQRRQLARQALALRLVLHDKPAIPGPPAIMGEAEKGEGFRTPFAALLTSQGRKPAELDQPRLILMERQAKLGQPVLEVNQHPLRVGRFLKAHHEVVSVTHDRHPTGRAPPPPLVDPEIKRTSRYRNARKTRFRPGVEGRPRPVGPARPAYG